MSQMVLSMQDKQADTEGLLHPEAGQHYLPLVNVPLCPGSGILDLHCPLSFYLGYLG